MAKAMDFMDTTRFLEIVSELSLGSKSMASAMVRTQLNSMHQRQIANPDVVPEEVSLSTRAELASGKVISAGS